MDEALFQQLLTAPPTPAAPQGAAPPQPQTDQPGAAPTQAAFEAGLPGDLKTPGKDALGEPTDFLDAAAGGAAKAAFETKDFLFGETPKADQSGIRRSVEAGTAKAEQASVPNALIGGISQFAVGLLGAGKLAAVTKLPEIAAGVGKAAEMGLESLKAATVGAVAFDPHQERLSNLIQASPILSNPVTQWLSAKPDDSAAAGRAKAALESIGLDAALVGSFMAAGKVYRALSSGDHAEVPAAVQELEAAQGKAVRQEEQAASQEPQAASEATGAPQEAPQSSEGQPATVGPEGENPAPTATQSGSDAVSAAGEAPAATSQPMEMSLANDNVIHGEAGFEPNPGGQATPGVTSPAAAKFKPSAIIEPDQAEALVKGIRSDLDAIDAAGSVQGAVEEGHVFGQGEGVPWNKLNLPGEVDDFVARVADAIESDTAALKGGEVLSDASVARRVNGLVAYFNLDPASIAGSIQQAGRAASKMVAQMEAAYLISMKMFQETFAFANRIGLGDFTGFASREAALAEFERQVTLAGSMFASGQSMRAAFGRGLRRQRSEFAIAPEMVDRVKAVGGDRLAQLFAQTLGDPKKLKRIVQPTFLDKATTDLGFLVQNNLLWGWGTHAVNALSNGYMMLARPAQRAVGATIQGDLASAKEYLSQYGYYTTSMRDAFSASWNALKAADSIISPHNTAFAGERNAQGPIAKIGTTNDWLPFDSVYGFTNNAMRAVIRAATFPVRSMAAADEMAKQLVYRAKVQSAAQAEGSAQGLVGSDLRKYVADKLDGAFDEAGRGIDKEALQEARVSTFSQDLAPGSFGKWLQTGASQHPLMRLIFPFIQTPMNIFRYSVKEFPGAGMFQRDFRDMLFGKMGPEAQQQAIGQMSLGAVALGAIAESGLTMTGGGPADPKVRDAMMSTGWRPYSIVYTDDRGVKTFFPIGRVDPIALPFGIVADIQDYLHQGNDASKVQATINALTFGLIKQVTNKSYMAGLAHVVDALNDPQRNLAKFTGQTLNELVPFSSLLKGLNFDPYMREARSAMDYVMANTPGISETMPAKYDAMGEKVPTRNLFISASAPDKVTAEIQRMGMKGYDLIPPTPTIQHADLRDITTKDGKSAWEWYQQLAGKPSPNAPSLRDQVAKIMDTPAYDKAPDGPADVKGTKLWLLHEPVVTYRKAAELAIQKDPNVREALYSAQKKVNDAYHAQKAGVQTQSTNADAVRNIVGRMTSFLSPPPLPQ